MGCLVNWDKGNILFCSRIRKVPQALHFRVVVSSLGTDAGQPLRVPLVGQWYEYFARSFTL